VKKKHAVLGVTGSIAAYKAADIIRLLQAKNVRVSVIMTACAEKFITPLTLATLSSQKVHREMFDEGENERNIDHVSLAQSANVLLIAPATANIVGKIACGLADDLLTCTALATKAPILIAPAMNEGMYQNKIYRGNCKKLKDLGVKFIDPVKGKLACGDVGVGHIAEVKDIVKAVLAELK
jgi:phosphopantothenoylcysteine decarboxylase/phosphopantothenate--cysteine ligase